MKNIVSVQQAETCSSEHSESKSSGLSGRNLLVLCFGWDVKTKGDVLDDRCSCRGVNV